MAAWRSPLRTLHACLAGLLWTSRGRRAMARGDLPAAVRALELAVSWRPRAFKSLFLLGRGYLASDDTWRAHRALARARETDPLRFAREAERCVARRSLDRETLGRVLGVGLTAAPSPSPARVHARSLEARRETVPNLPFGDCLDLDEYARFQAMPPISRAERESVDWDSLLADLLED